MMMMRKIFSLLCHYPFLQYFRESDGFTKEVTKELISRKFFERDCVLKHFFTLIETNFVKSTL